MEFISTTQD